MHDKFRVMLGYPSRFKVAMETERVRISDTECVIDIGWSILDELQPFPHKLPLSRASHFAHFFFHIAT